MKCIVRKVVFVGLLSAVSFLAYSQSVSSAEAEVTTAEAINGPALAVVPGETAIAPQIRINVPRAVLRTPAEMQDSPSIAAARRFNYLHNRPAMGMARYLAAKAAAATGSPSADPSTATTPSATLAPPSATFQIEGVNETAAGGSVPPDTHGAVGPTHFVEVTNEHLDIYVKSTGARVKSVTLASFFGFSASGIFDPRVLYDRTYSRWIIIADTDPISSADQRQLIGISQTSSPLGTFFIYTNFNVMTALGNDRFWDFPQLGMDQDSILLTANVFLGDTNEGARLFAIAKAKLYNGLAFSVPVFKFSSAVGTVAPPVVLDQSAKTFLVAAPTSGSALKLFILRDSSNAFDATLTGPLNVAVAAYTLPPNAVQCGGVGVAEMLDSADSRFVNASTQIGNQLWNAHSVASGGRAAIRWYKINTTTRTVTQSKTHSQTTTSSDFNVSIAASDAGDYFLTWTSSSSTGCPQVIYNGERAGVLAPTAGKILFTSPTKITGSFDPNFGLQRWGDYSAVTIDPSNASDAWLVNEKVNSPAVWGSRIGKIRIP